MPKKTFSELGFKEGDKVRCLFPLPEGEEYYKHGEMFTLERDTFGGLVTSEGLAGYFADWELVLPEYKIDVWYALNKHPYPDNYAMCQLEYSKDRHGNVTHWKIAPSKEEKHTLYYDGTGFYNRPSEFCDFYAIHITVTNGVPQPTVQVEEL